MLKNLRSILRFKSFVLTTAACCFINLALATELARSQDLDKQITLDVDKKPLKQTLDLISARSHVSIIYSNTKGIINILVTVHVKDEPVKKILNDLFAPLSLTYQVIDDRIVVKFDDSTPRPPSQVQPRSPLFPIKGKVTDANGLPLPGATIKIKNGPVVSTTDSEGMFSITNVSDSTILEISFVGYFKREVQVNKSIFLTVSLNVSGSQLNEVSVVSTGYQTLTKEKATGSYTTVDNKTFNRTISSDVLSRLKGVTNGLLFDNTTGNTQGISVRGRSTIYSNTAPLIVVDNFPFEGDINTLNPNDVENVTVLKDAAAAAIWGVRAGNGVIVITTKSGRLNQKPTVNINSNFTIGDKPNLFYRPQLSSSEFIDLEKYLFNQGAYSNALSNDYQIISPVVALLQKAQANPSFANQANSQIDALRNLDVRNQQSQYYYRKSIQQQYHADINGGSTNDIYYFSAGYDKDMPNDVASSDSRLTIKGKNTYSFLEGKLKLNTDISFSKSKSENDNIQGFLPYYPYDQVADQSGNPLPVLTRGGLRAQYTDTVGNGKLLDWKFKPLEELRNKNAVQTTTATDYRLNLGLSYKIFSPLTVSAYYEYYNAATNIDALYNQDSYYVRNSVNTFSSINTSTGTVNRPFPYGDVYDPQVSGTTSNYGRGQLDYNETFNGKHRINAIAGYEVREDTYKLNNFTVYNYNPSTATSTPIDLLNQYAYYYGTSSSTLGNNYAYFSNTLDRYISYYANASYTYKDEYIVSGSYRKDESNLFGVKANQKGVPLWSSGLAWKLDKEKVFQTNWLNSLQVKATYGYNGNVNKTVSAYLTASPTYINNLYQVPTNQIINPPDDNLRWERIQNLNLGIYFSAFGNRISGSFEYYAKNGKDLIATSPIAPQTGVTLFTGNTANTQASGYDLQLNSTNLNGPFRWITNWIIDKSTDKVTSYMVATGSNQDLLTSNTIVPIVGYPINSIFAYKWGGLDGSGNPQGYLNGTKSIDYTSIQNSNGRNQLDFFGSGTPTLFGSIRNTFSYKSLELSFNIIYKFNYYFRAPALNYSTLFAGDYQQPGYSKRWVKPGDELKTTVPSAVYPGDASRDAFYQYSSINVVKGDHIRLQDIQLNYTLSKHQLKWLPTEKVNLYFYTTNLGILWRANKEGIDPDFVTANYPNPKTFAFGLRTNF